MQANTPSPRPAGCPADADVDWQKRSLPILARSDSPKGRGAPVAQDRALTARKHRCDPSPFVAECAMPDRINTAMKSMQGAGRYATGDTGRGEAC